MGSTAIEEHSNDDKFGNASSIEAIGRIVGIIRVRHVNVVGICNKVCSILVIWYVFSSCMVSDKGVNEMQ